MKKNNGFEIERFKILPSEMEGVYGWRSRGDDILDLESILQQIGVGEKYVDQESLRVPQYFAFWVEGQTKSIEYLEGEKVGTYMVRKSGNGDQSVLSVRKGNEIVHYAIESTCGQVSVDEIRKVVDKITEIKEQDNSVLKFELNAQERRLALEKKGSESNQSKKKN